MKKKLIIAAGILCCLGAILAVSGFALLGFSVERLDLGDPLTEVKIQFDLEQVEKISLSNVNFSVIVQPSIDDLVHFTYYENEEHTFAIHHDSEKIAIEEKVHFNFWKNFTYMFSDMALSKKILILEIPLSYKEQLQLSSVNGNITVRGFEDLSSLKVDNTNGKILLDQVSATQYSLSTVNGNSEVLKNEGIDFQYNTVNGSLHLDSALFEQYSFDTVNGRIYGTISGKQDEYSISISRINGSVNLPSQKVIGSSKKIDISTVNGNTNLEFIS